MTDVEMRRLGVIVIVAALIGAFAVAVWPRSQPRPNIEALLALHRDCIKYDVFDNAPDLATLEQCRTNRDALQQARGY